MLGFIYALIGVAVLIALLHYKKVKTDTRRRTYIQNYNLTFLRPKLRKYHPTLSDTDLPQVESGLKQFFLANLLLKGQSLAMPSKVVDTLWHEFILHTKTYHEFCQQAFGRFLHHCPSEAMQGSNKAQLSIRKTWRACCSIASISPRKPHQLPILFALDAQLHIPDGYYYTTAEFQSDQTEPKHDDTLAIYAGNIGCTTLKSGDGNADGADSSASSCSSGSSCGSGCSS